VDATFDTTPPDLSRIPGVTAVDVEGNRVRCQVIGSVEPLLGVLAASGVHQLLSREPSLEELFLAHYGRRRAGQPTQRHAPPGQRPGRRRLRGSVPDPHGRRRCDQPGVAERGAAASSGGGLTWPDSSATTSSTTPRDG
jgi:hypothetical protein